MNTEKRRDIIAGAVLSKGGAKKGRRYGKIGGKHSGSSVITTVKKTDSVWAEGFAPNYDQ